MHGRYDFSLCVVLVLTTVATNSVLKAARVARSHTRHTALTLFIQGGAGAVEQSEMAQWVKVRQMGEESTGRIVLAQGITLSYSNHSRKHLKCDRNMNIILIYLAHMTSPL